MKRYDSLSDEELWVLSASNGEAFGELFERHEDAVYGHCFRRTGSWATAEDLTSVVFMETWRRGKEIEFHGESFLPWLLAVANNVIRNANRSTRRYRRLLAKLPKPAAIPDETEEAIERIDDERTMRNLLDAFNRLSRLDQEVISVCDWAGLTYEEAAIALKVPIGTIRSRLFRARGRLRGLLTGRTEETGDPSKTQDTPEGGES